MVSASQLAAFAVASLIIIVIPGPGVLFVVGRALAHGRRTALASVVGHATGNAMIAVAVAFGIGALVERSQLVFTVTKIAGACYLVWLGVQAVRHRHRLTAAFAEAPAPRGDGKAALEGFVVGVTNPKAVILFATLLPEFVHRGAGNVPAQMLVLSAVSLVIGLTSDSVWSLLAGTVRDWFARSPDRLALVGGAGGLAMIGLGLSLAVTGNKR
jgi:threonine/homoserine/homoserine lactone efflux protein